MKVWFDFFHTLVHELGHAAVAWFLGARIERILVGAQTGRRGDVFALFAPGSEGYSGAGLCVYTGLEGTWRRALVSAAGFLAVFGLLSFIEMVTVTISAFLFWILGMPIELVVFVEWLFFFTSTAFIIIFAIHGCQEDLHDIRYELDWRATVSTLE